MNDQIIILDGIKMKYSPPDLDGDGQSGGIESVSPELSVQNIVQPTELGETLKELNMDNITPNTRMSGIDMRSRLHYSEISSVLAIDALVALGVLPTKCLAFTRQKKRLAVSLQGKGREEIVQIVGGKRDMDAKAGMGGMGDKMKNFMGMNNK